MTDPNIVLKIKAYELYSKYIRNGAYYQINTSFKVNDSFAQKNFEDFDTLLKTNITANEIRTLFIEPTKEVESLLKQTFIRFYADYHTIQHV